MQILQVAPMSDDRTSGRMAELKRQRDWYRDVHVPNLMAERKALWGERDRLSQCVRVLLRYMDNEACCELMERGKGPCDHCNAKAEALARLGSYREGALYGYQMGGDGA